MPISDPFGLGQDGVATRRQLLARGVSDAQLRARLRTGRWQGMDVGVYATFSGPAPPRTLVWAAILRAGPGAVAGPRTSLWLAGATDRLPSRLDVVVPGERRVRGVGQVKVSRRGRLAEAAHPASRPPRLRLEVAVLDVCGDCDRPEAAVDLVVRVVQRRLTTAARLREWLAAQPRHCRRRLLADVLADVEQGVRSALERRWLNDVQRAHGLPRSVLNQGDDGEGRRRYRDVVFVEFGLVVELDGREAHPADQAFRDRRRDNLVTVGGRRTLRYGWREISQDPCGVAAEVAAVLTCLGWTGTPHPCGPTCRLPKVPPS